MVNSVQRSLALYKNAKKAVLYMRTAFFVSG